MVGIGLDWWVGRLVDWRTGGLVDWPDEAKRVMNKTSWLWKEVWRIRQVRRRHEGSCSIISFSDRFVATEPKGENRVNIIADFDKKVSDGKETSMGVLLLHKY